MITNQQIIMLQFIIGRIPYIDTGAKKLYHILLANSENLTQEVCTSLIDGQDGWTADLVRHIAYDHAIATSFAGQVLINEILSLTGSGFRFSIHFGDFDATRGEQSVDSSGQFSGFSVVQALGKEYLTRSDTLLRYTFWLAREQHSPKAKHIPITRGTLNSVELITYPTYT